MRMWRVLTVLAVFAGCDFDTSRTEGLGDGEIRARAVRKDGAPAVGAVVAVTGSDRVTQAGANGEVVLDALVPGRWILRLSEDDDGDGAPERGAYVSAELRRAGVPKNLTDGCSGEPPNVTTSFLAGDVALEDTGTLIGAVSLDDGDGGDGVMGPDERARVVVWREIDGYATAIGASAGVSPNGTYRIDGVLPGPVHVAAYVYDVLSGANAPKLFGTVDVDVVGGGENLADVFAGDETLLEGGGARLASAQVEAQWSQPEPAAVEIVQITYGAPVSGAIVGPSPGAPPGAGVIIEQDARAFVVDPPIGVVDILFSSATEGAADGLLRGYAIVPRDGGGGGQLGPVELPLLIDRCVLDDGTRDCDHDGLPGLPFPSGDDDPVWAACADACAGALGVDGARATCTSGGVEVDCDDDGDGQPDVTEPARCFGAAVGTDYDSDDLCEPAEDPFPYCDGDECVAPEFAPPESRY
jgi:hypothetical protein